jgi:hypothetical protein
VDALMAPLGHAEWFDDEELFALAGHLTGAGPAFVYRFIDALAAAAAQLGLPPDQALRLATAWSKGPAPWPPLRTSRRRSSPGGSPAPAARPRRACACWTVRTRWRADAAHSGGVAAARARAGPQPAALTCF